MKFLDLPPSGSRPLERMSGGQQRRASLALALLHQPDLLILDEPTVGVDPLLRYAHTDKKENTIFLTYKEIQSGEVAKSYMTNGLLIQYMGKYLRISSYMRNHI